MQRATARSIEERGLEHEDSHPTIGHNHITSMRSVFVLVQEEYNYSQSQALNILSNFMNVEDIEPEELVITDTEFGSVIGLDGYGLCELCTQQDCRDCDLVNTLNMINDEQDATEPRAYDCSNTLRPECYILAEDGSVVRDTEGTRTGTILPPGTVQCKAGGIDVLTATDPQDKTKTDFVVLVYPTHVVYYHQGQERIVALGSGIREYGTNEVWGDDSLLLISADDVLSRLSVNCDGSYDIEQLEQGVVSCSMLKSVKHYAGDKR